MAYELHTLSEKGKWEFTLTDDDGDVLNIEENSDVEETLLIDAAEYGVILTKDDATDLVQWLNEWISSH